MTITTPSAESLVRLLFAVGGVVTGVASTVAGSWISSKIHVYHENKTAHLEDIKQKVLIPLGDVFTREYAVLVTHKSPAVLEVWGPRSRRENASVTEHQSEEGPLLRAALPDMRAGLDPALYTDARRNHFSKLLGQAESFSETWCSHANECHAWVDHLSGEILAKSQMEPIPVKQYGISYVDHYKLGLFVYRRLFRGSEHSLLKHARNPPTWVLEGFEGTSAEGTEQQLGALVSVLDDLVVKEGNTAGRLQANARVLEQRLSSLRAELNYAIASRRLRKKCDLVPFF